MFYAGKVNKVDWRTFIKCFGRQLDSRSIWNNQHWNVVKTDLLNASSSYKLSQHHYDSKELSLLKKLAERDDLVILKPDKGNGIVLLDKLMYKNKMNLISSDNTKFEHINEDY